MGWLQIRDPSSRDRRLVWAGSQDGRVELGAQEAGQHLPPRQGLGAGGTCWCRLLSTLQPHFHVQHIRSGVCGLGCSDHCVELRYGARPSLPRLPVPSLPSGPSPSPCRRCQDFRHYRPVHSTMPRRWDRTTGRRACLASSSWRDRLRSLCRPSVSERASRWGRERSVTRTRQVPRGLFTS